METTIVRAPAVVFCRRFSAPLDEARRVIVDINTRVIALAEGLGRSAGAEHDAG
jgi:hypothetical protein